MQCFCGRTADLRGVDLGWVDYCAGQAYSLCICVRLDLSPNKVMNAENSQQTQHSPAQNHYLKLNKWETPFLPGNVVQNLHRGAWDVSVLLEIDCTCVPGHRCDGTEKGVYTSTTRMVYHKSRHRAGCQQWPLHFFNRDIMNLRPSSHRTRSTSQPAYTNFLTHYHQWDCSHRLQATSKGLRANLRANLLTRPVWTGPQSFGVLVS